QMSRMMGGDFLASSPLRWNYRNQADCFVLAELPHPRRAAGSGRSSVSNPSPAPAAPRGRTCPHVLVADLRTTSRLDDKSIQVLNQVEKFFGGEISADLAAIRCRDGEPQTLGIGRFDREDVAVLRRKVCEFAQHRRTIHPRQPRSLQNRSGAR